MNPPSKATPPVIIIGMHRSGTSMIASMLEELGLYIGKKKEGNHEAVFFLELNDWMLRQSGGAWDNPEPFKYLLANEKMRQLVKGYLEFSLRTPRVTSYLGLGNYLNYRSPLNLDIPWGWKDPRNTYTLPIWQDIFPAAKVIHVFRNGVDVANSLKVRQEKRLARGQELYRRRKPLFNLLSKRGGFTHSARCSSLMGSFSLWEEYLQEAQRHVAALGHRALEVHYESFLERPQAHLANLVDFCNLDVTASRIEEVAGHVKKTRANAYQDKPELLEFSKEVSDRLKVYGYD